MSQVISKQILNVPAKKVWELIGSFNALASWHPAVERSALSDDGSIRTLSLVGGGQVIERLEKLDECSHEYSYSIVDSPLPVTDYSSTLKVIPKGDDSCSVEWASQFNPLGASAEDAEVAIKGLYEAGFANLKKIFACD